MRVADVAFASGFGSIRQFNDTIRAVYERSPLELRATAHRRLPHPAADAGVVRLRLPARAPFDAAGVFAWLATRARRGRGRPARPLRADARAADRTVARAALGGARLPRARGRGPAREPRRPRAARRARAPVRPRRRRGRDRRRPRRRPRARGVRSGGARHPHAQRARPARARGARARRAAGLRGIRPHLAHQARRRARRARRARRTDAHAVPDARRDRRPRRRRAARARRAHPHDRRGVRAARVRQLVVAPERERAELRADLLALPGIGPWTAGYLAMRVTREPDELLVSDLALRNGAVRLGLPGDPRALAARGEAWAPWRSYASMHLWRAAAAPEPRTRVVDVEAIGCLRCTPRTGSLAARPIAWTGEVRTPPSRRPADPRLATVIDDGALFLDDVMADAPHDLQCLIERGPDASTRSARRSTPSWPRALRPRRSPSSATPRGAPSRAGARDRGELRGARLEARGSAPRPR